jgi:HEAT repeat protein
MATVPAEPMSSEQNAALVEFARSCKTAARSVSLYPASHPAIQGALGRVVASARRLTDTGDVTIAILPDVLLVEGRAPAKPDSAIGEFAELLHSRLVGELRVERDADAGEWHALLSLMARSPEDLLADGGLAKAWAATGHSHFGIREIDYAEVLREHTGAGGAEWARIIEFCLHGSDATIEERVLDAVIAALDSDRFGELVKAVQSSETARSASVGARAAALLHLLRKAIERLRRDDRLDEAAVLRSVADSAAQMTPDTMLSFLQEARAEKERGDTPVAAPVIERITDSSVAQFVAGSIVAERGASERLAQAFRTLVPEVERKARLLDLAKVVAQQTPLGKETEFESLWKGAATLLTSYSDESFVSEEYGRELSSSRAQALEVERVSDDPPERIQTWLASVSDGAVRELDIALIQDLLRIEHDPASWHTIAAVAADEIERRTLLGDIHTASTLLSILVAERSDGRTALRPVANSVLAKLAGGQLIRHLVTHLRKVDDADVEPLTRFCHAIGPPIVRPLAMALAAEENNRAIRRLRELLLSFGAAGRQSVEQLKHSPNPAVRRMAIDLLRVFGGREALPELASMLDDADPQVQRESIRAIVQIGTDEAFAVLETALVSGSASRETILQQLINLRDDKAAPLLCYVLNHTSPKRNLVAVHVQIIEALGNLAARSDSIGTLRGILHRGEWWAPWRTATLRHAAAAALQRLGSAEAAAVLSEAAIRGNRGVRNVARRYAPRGGV